MPGQKDEIRKAREVLEQERAEVLAALGAARASAQKIAHEQSAWREAVTTLLERGDAAGLSVTEMAKALGLSRQWTSHLRAEAVRRARFASAKLWLRPPPGTAP
jgi:hypothetical protein